LAMVNMRRGPNCASMGSAHEALVGVRHSSTLCAAAHVRIAGVVLTDRLSQTDDVDRSAVRASGADGLERGEGVRAALVFVQDAPQLVLAQAVAAVEVADPVGAVVGRGQPVGVSPGRPAGAVAGTDGQRPELVEREAPVGKPGHHLVDTVQLGVVGRVGRRLPGPGALEADIVLVQDRPDAFAIDPDRPRRDPGRVPVAVVAVQVGGQLADAPVRERQAEPLRPGLAVATTTSMSASVIRRGRPGPQRGANIARPWTLNAWMTSRTVSGSAATNRAMAGTPVPADDAMMISARRYRTLL
jgi:hypothetical protein